MYPSLIEFLCEKFGCDSRALKKLMQTPRNVRLAERFLEHKMVRTTYAKRTPRCFKAGTLSLKNAYTQDAFEGVKGVKIDVYYYCKYKIWLDFAALPLVVQDVGNGHFRYFPLECLTVAFTLTATEAPPFKRVRFGTTSTVPAADKDDDVSSIWHNIDV
ncbi:hypothetical protein AAVH_16859 [Aphelenchoides avenae]|nr:hypothetical protein AAVH_16859 [Aphelenchus avenae]